MANTISPDRILYSCPNGSAVMLPPPRPYSAASDNEQSTEVYKLIPNHWFLCASFVRRFVPWLEWYRHLFDHHQPNLIRKYKLVPIQQVMLSSPSSSFVHSDLLLKMDRYDWDLEVLMSSHPESLHLPRCLTIAASISIALSTIHRLSSGLSERSGPEAAGSNSSSNSRSGPLMPPPTRRLAYGALRPSKILISFHSPHTRHTHPHPNAPLLVVVGDAANNQQQDVLEVGLVPCYTHCLPFQLQSNDAKSYLYRPPEDLPCNSLESEDDHKERRTAQPSGAQRLSTQEGDMWSFGMILLELFVLCRAPARSPIERWWRNYCAACRAEEIATGPVEDPLQSNDLSMHRPGNGASKPYPIKISTVAAAAVMDATSLGSERAHTVIDLLRTLLMRPTPKEPSLLATSLCSVPPAIGELISQLLVWEPEKRIKAVDCLKNPLLQPFVPSALPPLEPAAATGVRVAETHTAHPTQVSLLRKLQAMT